MNNSNSSDNSTAPSSDPSELVRNSMLYTLTITGSVTVLMNVFVLAVIWRYSWMRTNANLIIASMAVTDLVAGISTVTSGLVKWTDHFHVSHTFCVIYNIVDITVAFASLQHVVGVNLERYLAIIKPLHYKKLFTKAKLYGYIVFAWLWSLILTLMYVFNMVLLDKCLQDIPKNPIWTLISLIFSYPVPLLTIIAIYIHIVIVIIRQLNFMKKHSAGNVRIKSKQLKMIKNVASIFAAYVICWAPTMSVLMAVSISLLLQVSLDFSNFVTMFYFVEVLSYANSLVNPIIYFLGSRSFQKAARKMLHMKEPSQPRTQETASTSLQQSEKNKTKSVLCLDENRSNENNTTGNTISANEPCRARIEGSRAGEENSDVEVGVSGTILHSTDRKGVINRAYDHHDEVMRDENNPPQLKPKTTSDRTNNMETSHAQINGEYVNQETDNTRL